MPGVATASPTASTNRGRVVIIAGPPCSGKGTQCARLAEAQGWVHISTGDVFRSEVAAGTELGLQAKEYLDAGAFVPDELVIGYIVGRLAEPEVQATVSFSTATRALPSRRKRSSRGFTSMLPS